MPRVSVIGKPLLTFLAILAAAPAGSLAGDEVSLYDYVHADVDGKETTLGPYKGKILVMEFFATWCPPCRKDLPGIASLQEKYPLAKVAFVAMSADGSTNTVGRLPAFVQEMGLKIPVYVGGSLFVDKFAGVDANGGRQIVLPQTYVFSGEGEILMRYVGEQKSKKKSLAEELDRLVKGTVS